MNEHVDRHTLEVYVEQALPAVQRRAVEAHLTACPMCQARLANAKQMTALLYTLPREIPAPDLAARINAAIAARRAPAQVQWTRALVPAAFVAGLVLLALAAPQWSGWAQAAVTAQLPSEPTMLAWLSNLGTDPAAALDTLVALVEQAIAGPTEEVSVLLTLATVLLTSASVAGLAQLLGGERPPIATAGTGE